MPHINETHLSELAKQRLRSIRRRADAAHAVRGMLSDRRNAALDLKRQAQDVLNKPLWRATDLRADDAAREAAVARIDVAMAEIADIDKRMAALPQTALPGRVDAFLKRLPVGPIAAGPVAKPSPKRGESNVALVERLRGELASLKADLREVQAAPIPAADAKRLIRAQVEELAAQGAPRVLGTIEAGLPFAWPLEALHDTKIASQGAGVVPGLLALLCWANRETLIAKLEADADALADDSRALDASMRGFRERELLTQMLATERQECAAIFDAEETGEQIDFRSDVDVRAVLGFADSVVA